MPAQAQLMKGFGVEILGLSDVVDGGRLPRRFGEVMGKPRPGADISGIQGGTMGRPAVAIAIEDEGAVIEQGPEGRLQGAPGGTLEGPGKFIKAQPKLLRMGLVMVVG